MKELCETIKNAYHKRDIVFLVRELAKNQIIKYIFFGVLSTCVNFGVFYMLHQIYHWEVFTANLLSISCAVLFAYVVNARFVFQSQVKGTAIIRELVTFVGARLSTMLIELFGVTAMVDFLHINALLSKIFINVIVLILNYIFSAFIFNKQ